MPSMVLVIKKSFTVHGRFYTALFVTLQYENESYSLLMNYINISPHQKSGLPSE